MELKCSQEKFVTDPLFYVLMDFNEISYRVENTEIQV